MTWIKRLWARIQFEVKYRRKKLKQQKNEKPFIYF